MHTEVAHAHLIESLETFQFQQNFNEMWKKNFDKIEG